MSHHVKRTVLGIAFLVIAALVILSICKVGIFAGLFTGLNWFQILVAAFCVVMFICGVAEFGIIRIFASLGILYAIFQDRLALTDIPTSGIIAAVILISIGLKLLLPKSWQSKWSYCSSHDGESSYIKDGMRYKSYEDFQNGVNGQPINCVSEDGNDVEVNFGSTAKYYNVDNFRRADLESNFGSIKAFFDKAQMAEDYAEIFVECNFGSVELFIPKEWSVSIRKESFAGSVEEKGHQEPDGIHTVRINGEVNFGSLLIHHV